MRNFASAGVGPAAGRCCSVGSTAWCWGPSRIAQGSSSESLPESVLQAVQQAVEQAVQLEGTYGAAGGTTGSTVGGTYSAVGSTAAYGNGR